MTSKNRPDKAERITSSSGGNGSSSSGSFGAVKLITLT